MQRSNETDDVTPDEAFLYFPGPHDIKTPDGIRRIFDGSVKFDDYERKMIDEFKKYCPKHNHVLLSIWTDSRILRFLQANRYKLDKTLTSIKENDRSLAERLPIKKTPFLDEFLTKSMMYVHGRDRYYRPIIVFNAYKLDPKTSDVDELINGLTFFFEYIIANLLLPGQILKKIVGYLQNNYRGHLWTMNIINTPSSIFIPWAIVKSFLDEVTIKKIQFFKTNVPTSIFEFTNKEQVEEKFGGTAKNVTNYWPPNFPSKRYLLPSNDPEKILITRREYTRRYQAGSLKGHKVNEKLLVQDENLDIVSASKVTNGNKSTEMSSLQLLSNQSAPVKHRENRAVTDFVNQSASLKNSPVIVSKLSKSKDDQDMDEFNYDIKFMDEDVEIKQTTHISRLPQKTYVYFQVKGDMNPLKK